MILRRCRPFGSILLLGGTSDIGGAIILECLRDGAADLQLVGRNRDELEVAAGKFRAAGAQTISILECDFNYHDQISLLLRHLRALPNAELVVVAVGSNPVGPRLEDQVTGTNFSGPAEFLIEYLRQTDTKPGFLVLLSSFAAVRPRPSNFAYGASKRGLEFLTLGLQVTYPQISVTIIRLGKVLTRMSAGYPSTPMDLTTEEAAKRIVRAVGRGRRVAWIPYTTRFVAIATRMLPGKVLGRLDRKWTPSK